MADQTDSHDLEPTPDEAKLAVAARHALHDEELIAAFASNDPDLDEDETKRARSLVERCVACRDLAADLAAITTAHAASRSMTAPARRDFRLTPEDAARLGRPAVLRRSWWERFAIAVRGFGRPLGGSLVAIGLVGVLIGGFGSMGMPAAAPALPMTSTGGASTEAPRDASNPGAYAPGPTGEALSQEGDDVGGRASDTAPGPSPLLLITLGSLGLLIVGIVLLAATLRRPRSS